MNKEILKRYFEGRSSRWEKRQVMEYLEGDDLSLLDEYINEQGAAGDMQLIGNEVKEEFYEQLEKKIQEREHLGTKKRKRLLNNPFMRIAASILLIASVISGWMYLEKGRRQRKGSLPINLTSISNTGRQMKVVALSDGTRVWMNPGTTVTYDNNAFNDKTRQVTVSGEAIFNVTQDDARPFHVKTGALSTVVLGTSFHVEAYENETDTRITLLSGKVRVDGAGGNRILLPGQVLEYSRGKNVVSVSQVDISGEEDMLTSGMIVFRNLPLEDVIRRMERIFNIRIVPADPLLLENKFITGSYYRKNAEEDLTRILFIHGLHLKKKGTDHYIITK
jgi:ferric-dicitrate binding protein FerR (iron transport regulator)